MSAWTFTCRVIGTSLWGQQVPGIGVGDRGGKGETGA